MTITRNPREAALERAARPAKIKRQAAAWKAKREAHTRINPNPRLAALLDYAIDEVSVRLSSRDEYREWQDWAAAWKAGDRLPGRCVAVGHHYFAHRDDPLFDCLGQLAWAGKEACYDSPTSGWLVIRYIADAMIAFGVAFTDDAATALRLPPPTVPQEDEGDMTNEGRDDG